MAEDLKHVWAEAWPYLKKSIDSFPNVRNPYTLKGLLTDLLVHKAQLWIAWNIPEDKLYGAVVTEILTDLDRRNSRVLCIAIIGGDRLHEWAHSLWDVIREWAIHNGCEIVVYRGRKGWSRMFGLSYVKHDEDNIPLYYRRIIKR